MAVARDAALLEVTLKRFYDWAMKDIFDFMEGVRLVIGNITKLAGKQSSIHWVAQPQSRTKKRRPD